MDDRIMLGIGTIGCLLSEFLFGGLQQNLIILLAVMLIDVLFGATSAWLAKSPKTENGGFSSEAMLHGFMKKILTLGLISVAHFCDVILGINYLYNACVIAFIAQECFSIIETYALVVEEPPEILVRGLELLKKESEKDE